MAPERSRNASGEARSTPPTALSERAAAALRQVRRYVQALAEDSVPTAVLDPHGLVLAANQAMGRRFGAPGGRLDRRNLLDLVHVQDRARLATQIDRIATASGEGFAEPVRVRRGDGGVLPGIAFPTARPERGSAPAVVLTAPERIVDASQVPSVSGPVRAMVVVDAHGFVRLADQGSRACGLDPEHLVAISSLLLVHPGDLPELLEAVESTAPREPASVGLRLLQADGTWAPHRADLRGLADSEGSAGFALSCTDARSAGALVTAQRFPQLTEREREVLARLADGQRVRTMAQELYVSESTVRGHLSAVFRKLGVRSQIELTEQLRAERI